MAHDDEILQRMMANNRAWKAGVDKDDPGFFARMAQHHAPRVLWIGCSDSRVPGNESVGFMPGDLAPSAYILSGLGAPFAFGTYVYVGSRLVSPTLGARALIWVN